MLDGGAGLWTSGGTLGHVSTLSSQILVVEPPLQIYIFQSADHSGYRSFTPKLK